MVGHSLEIMPIVFLCEIPKMLLHSGSMTASFDSKG
jgi:hypothetical protein